MGSQRVGQDLEPEQQQQNIWKTSKLFAFSIANKIQNCFAFR